MIVREGQAGQDVRDLAQKLWDDAGPKDGDNDDGVLDQRRLVCERVFAPALQGLRTPAAMFAAPDCSRGDSIKRATAGPIGLCSSIAVASR
jgi:hypothetical protein